MKALFLSLVWVFFKKTVNKILHAPKCFPTRHEYAYKDHAKKKAKIELK